jgi:hypothetical protein
VLEITFLREIKVILQDLKALKVVILDKIMTIKREISFLLFTKSSFHVILKEIKAFSDSK